MCGIDLGKKQKTNIQILLETLEERGELDADQLEAITGIKKNIIVSTLFLAKKKKQIDSRPKGVSPTEGRFEFKVEDEEKCKRLAKFGWEVPEIADRLGMTETYVETMLMVSSAPVEIRDMIERGMIDVMNAVQSLQEKGERAKEAILVMLGGAPKEDGRKVSSKGQIYKFLTYTASKIEEPVVIEEPRPDFAAQLASFFTRGASEAIKLFDSHAKSQTVNLENFRGGAGPESDALWRRHQEESCGVIARRQ